MSQDQDTIFALSTSWMRSALHVHRISGKSFFSKIYPYFKKANHEKFHVKDDFISPLTKYLYLVDKDDEIIDDVMVTFYQSPHSYTGEDVCEITSHGNPHLTVKIHQFLRSLGMRDAMPGEFTQRAVLNGKLDLVQAEGINQLIHAETMGGIQLARSAAAGKLSQSVQELREQLLTLMSYLEAHIDFAPDEVGEFEPEKEILPGLNVLKEQVTRLLKSYSTGLKVREGLKFVLAGKPNAGKSSLYNSLLKHEKAIVTDIPGTTRDVLEDKMILGSRDIVLLDTAGIRNTTDVVEKIGVEKSRQALADSDLIGLLIDFSIHRFLNKDELKKIIDNEIADLELTEFIGKNIIIIGSKKDKINEHHLAVLNSLNSEEMGFFAFSKVSLSEQSELEDSLVEFYDKVFLGTSLKESSVLISARQRDKVKEALDFIEQAEELILKKDFPEKIASLLLHSTHSLFDIVGELSTDEILGKIFSTFCIGK